MSENGETGRSQRAEIFQEERMARNKAQAEQRRRQARLEQVEARIAELETELAEISNRLADPPSDLAEVERLGDDYVEIQNELDALLVEWESLH